MFDVTQVLEFMKAEPGHGLVQSLLLFMIWISSRGLRKELIELKTSLLEFKIHNEDRFKHIEDRITKLEITKGIA